MALTQKQENFCLEYVKCGNASEAYRRAYDAEGSKDETVWKRSSELMQNGDVKGRIDSLYQESKRSAIITIEQRKELLSRWIWEEETPNAMKALDLLNKMDAVYVQKQELSGGLGVKFEIDLGE